MFSVEFLPFLPSAVVWKYKLGVDKPFSLKSAFGQSFYQDSQQKAQWLTGPVMAKLPAEQGP